MVLIALEAGTVFVDVVPDTTGFAAKMQSQMAGVSSKMRKIGTTLTKSVSLPIVAVGALSLKAASDLNEAMTATDVTFGKSAKKIQAWSKTSATSMGLARVEALEGAKGFGAMLQTAGLATDASADMSITMVKLAGDMASFNDQDPSEMLERLRSGLAGEAEPLRRFGVFLSAAAVQAFAYKNGIAEAGAELTEAEKVQARYGVILEQTTKQQGDFARTSGSVANQTRTVKAQFTDTAAALGTALLPVAKQAAGILRGLLERFNGLSDGTKKWILIIGGIAAVAGPVIGAIGAIGGAMAFLAANPIVLVIAAVVGLAILIIANWDKIKKVTLNVFGAIGAFMTRAWTNIKNTVADLVGAMLAFLFRAFADFLQFWIKIAGGIIDTAAKAFGWVPRIGDKIEKFQTQFHKTTERILGDLRRQADHFDSWGEKAAGDILHVAGEWRSLRELLKAPLRAGIIHGVGKFAPGGGIGTGVPGSSSLTGIGQWLQSSGFRVTGHPAFPPIGGHTAGSYHYIGRAIDVNWGPGGGSAAEHSALASVAAKVGALFGGRILESLGPWNDAAHGGSNMHWHLAMDRGGIVKGPATIHQGAITEAHIPLSGPGAGMRIVGTLDTPFGPSMIDARVVDVLERNVRAVGPR